MKPKTIAHFSFLIASAILALLAGAWPLESHAATVTWGSATAIVNSTDIKSTTLVGALSVTNLAGADFGRANGTTTIVNNGASETGGVNVAFVSMNGNQTAALSNGVTVSSTFSHFNVAAGNAAPAGNYKTVLNRHMGQFGGSPTITLSGLTIGQEYQIQLFASGGDPNTNNIAGGPGLVVTGSTGQYAVGRFTADALTQVLTISGGEPVMNALTIGVVESEADATPPEWTATWPQVDSLSSTSLTVRAKTNEAGTAYYVVLPDGATAPTSAQVKAGTDNGDTPVSASGSLALTSNTEATAPVGSLSPGTDYNVYFVAEDAVPNLQADPIRVDASTSAPDVTEPDWIATWPQAEQLTATSITVRAQTNETGTAYYVVLADGAVAPSAAQVKAGNDSANAPATAAGSLALTANAEATAPVTGLTADTAYDVYFVAEDAVPNVQTNPVPVNITLVSPAVVTWGSWTPVSDETAIQTPGGYTYGGVNFNGSTTTIEGLVFTGIAQNASGSTNGVTVGSSGFAFQSTGNNSNVSSVVGAPQDWATVLDCVIGDDNNAATIELSGLSPGIAYTVQFFSNTPDPGLNATTVISSGGVDSAAFGGHSARQTRYIIASFTANSTSQSFSITGAEPTFGALVIGVESAGSTFADWIGGFSGLNGLTGFNDDADFDGLDNGLENFLGTAPNEFSAGVTAGTLSGNTFTFTHPQNATPASDVSAPVYTWSTDLVNWHASDASSGGITVNLAPDTDNPVAGTTTVTATVTGTVPAKLFVTLGVSQN
jgi:hypothetical protein